MHDGHLHQMIEVAMSHVAFERLQVVLQLEWRWRHEASLLNGAAHGANPVLILAELARRLVGTTHTVHQLGMHLPDQRQGDGTIRQKLAGQDQSLPVVDDLLDVLGLLRIEVETGFILQNLVDRRLGAFDLRRQHRLSVGEGRQHHAGVDDTLQ
ncbi:hypothetical protein D9M69_597450 [compost metagenome]